MRSVFILLMILTGFCSKAQMVLSEVNVETEMNGIFRNDKRQKAEIELNPMSQDLTINISLPAALLGVDTLTYNAPICLNLRGKFPYSNLDFYEEPKENKSYSMEAFIVLNGLGKQFTLPFNITKILPGRFATGAFVNYYPVYLNMTFGIDPVDFDLASKTSEEKKKVVISIPEGIINKNNDAVNTARCRNLD